MTYKTALIAGAAMLLSPMAYADGVNHDVTGFDIAGITLGMGADEAIATMTALTGVALADMSTGFPQDNPVTGNKEISYAVAETDDFIISVALTAAVPLDEAVPLVVSKITFEMPQTPENIASMRARAIDKYGPPTDGSVDDPDHFDLAWCAIPADNPTASCASGVGAHLSLGSGMNGFNAVRQLALFDISYADAVRDFINGENSSAPKF